MADQVDEEIKGKLLALIKQHLGEDTKFSDMNPDDQIPSKISEGAMNLLRNEESLPNHKLFCKAIVLQVNGMASSTNTLWCTEGEMRDRNFSVSWTNNVKCSVWLTA